jgi:hypothetical protein
VATLGHGLAQLTRLCLNWGILFALLAGVLAVRNDAAAAARAPLAAPRAELPPAVARQWRAFPHYTRTIPVLVYHGVNATRDPLSVTRTTFAQQMLALRAAGFHSITLAQYVRAVYGHRAGLPSRPVLLTFDDGRLDAYRGAQNTLRKYHLHATMFLFAGWPHTNPGFSLSWSEMARMRASGVWSVQEHGGFGHEYVIYDARGDDGGAFAFRRYLPARPGRGGRLESFPAFVHRVTGNILWGEHQLAARLHGYRPLAFAVPEGNYGQQKTNDPLIPMFMRAWLRQHFSVIFGGDYLAQGHGRFHLTARASGAVSYRITVGSRMTLPALYCRLRDWVTHVVLWREYRCLRMARDVEGQHGGWEERHEPGAEKRHERSPEERHEHGREPRGEKE